MEPWGTPYLTMQHVVVSNFIYVKYYLSGRQQEVHYAYIKLDTTTCCIVKYGVPQGSIITFFYNIR
jgi:hypothetical protein